MKDAREFIEQTKANLELGTKLETALVIAICEDGSVYRLDNMRVRPPVHAYEQDRDELIKLLRKS